MIKMKDSGVTWIGEIPNDWETRKIKQIVDYTIENSFIDGDWIESPYVEDSGIRYLTTGNIGDGYFKEQGNGYISLETFSALNCKYAYPDDLVISRLNSPYGRSCILPNTHDKYVLAVDNVILRPIAHKKYLCYVTQCSGYQTSVMENAKGTTMKRISRTNLGNVVIPFPPIDYQNRIADYLDKKCAKIDAIIEKQQTVIEKLKEYKLSIITEAVTKGLNPDVEMKDSEIEWIGTIPDNWELVKAKYCVYISHGSDPKSEGEIPVYGSGANSFRTCGEFKEGPTVLIGRKGATLHIPNYIEGRYWNVDTAFDVKVKEDYNLKFYYYNAICFDYKFYMSQTTLPGMTQESYKNMYITKPSITEQNKIVNFLDKKCSDIEKIIKQKQAIIDKTISYKKSLIYEVVTGKKEV